MNTQTSKTIRKNSKEFNAVMAGTSFTVYCLGNSFIGQKVSGIDQNTRVKKIDFTNGIYCIYVHSNLWYTTEK